MDNREIDAKIAEHIMDWKLFEGEPGYGRPPEKWSRPSLVLDEIPHYSTDIGAAWQVVEHLTRKDRTPGEADLYFKLTYAWDDEYGCWAYFDWKGTSDSHPLYGAQADTAPLAICMAALKAAGVVV